MRTIIAGSRTMGLKEVEAMIASCPWAGEITEVVSGRAPGADRAGEAWAKARNIPIKPFPAEWEKFGKSAGHRRNYNMGLYADALIAVWDGESPGTAGMIRIAKQMGLKVWPE